MIPVILLIILLLCPSLSIEGARQGLQLWFNVVIPTLAPFMICTQIITLFGGMRYLMVPFAPILHALFGLSPSGGCILLCGLLCGYPLGARMCADFASRRLISSKEARYLLSICNHPSPMFLLGFVREQLSGNPSPVLLLLCLYLPVIPLSRISRYVYGITGNTPVSCEAPVSIQELTSRKTPADDLQKKRLSLDEILLNTCETLVVIGGYIMLFSILAVWINQIFFLPPTTKAVLCGLAEITTGIHKLCICPELSSRLLPVIAVTAFGGFSGIFQTRSVIRSAGKDNVMSCNEKNAGLSIRHYVVWKLLHAILSCITVILLQQVPLP